MQRLIVQLVLTGGAVLGRAALLAYNNAVKNGLDKGIGQQSFRQIQRGNIQLSEAFLILGVKEATPLSEVYQKYLHLLRANQTQGSLYLESKVFRAWESIHDNKGPLDEGVQKQLLDEFNAKYGPPPDEDKKGGDERQDQDKAQ